MPSDASVTLLAHAGRDIEIRFTPGGSAVASFSVATNKWNGDGKEDTVTWWEVEVWGDRAERLNNRGVLKGDLLYIQGEPYLDKWTGREGDERQTLKLRAAKVLNLGKRDKHDAPGGGAPDRDLQDIPF